jgi:hypothetical protein
VGWPSLISGAGSIDPSGAFIAFSDHESLSVWHIASRRPTALLPVGSLLRGPRTFLLAPDRILLLPPRDELSLLRIPDGAPLWRAQPLGHVERVVVARRAGRVLVWTHTSVNILDLASGAVRVAKKLPPRPATSVWEPLAYADDGSVVANGENRSNGWVVEFLDGETLEPMGEMSFPDGRPDLAFDPVRGSLIAATSSLRRIDARARTVLTSTGPGPHARACETLSFSADGRKLACVGNDLVRLLDPLTLQDLQTVDRALVPKKGDALALDPSGDRLVSDSGIVFDIASRAIVFAPPDPFPPLWELEGLRERPDATLRDAHGRLEIDRQRSVMRSLPVSQRALHADETCEPSPTEHGRRACAAGGRWLARAEADHVMVLDTSAGVPEPRRLGPFQAVSSIALTPSGDRIAVRETSGGVSIWKLPEGSPVGELPLEGKLGETHVAFLGAGEMVAVGGAPLRLWRLRDGAVTRMFAPVVARDEVPFALVGPDGIAGNPEALEHIFFVRSTGDTTPRTALSLSGELPPLRIETWLPPPAVLVPDAATTRAARIARWVFFAGDRCEVVREQTLATMAAVEANCAGQRKAAICDDGGCEPFVPGWVAVDPATDLDRNGSKDAVIYWPGNGLSIFSPGKRGPSIWAVGDSTLTGRGVVNAQIVPLDRIVIGGRPLPPAVVMETKHWRGQRRLMVIDEELFSQVAVKGSTWPEVGPVKAGKTGECKLTTQGKEAGAIFSLELQIEHGRVGLLRIVEIMAGAGGETRVESRIRYVGADVTRPGWIELEYWASNETAVVGGSRRIRFRLRGKRLEVEGARQPGDCELH